MRAIPHESMSTTGQPLANLLFDYPDADIILRSQDGCQFRVPKTPIVNNSPILGELIRRTLDFPSDVNAGTSLPVVQLPESGEILRYILTFIFPVTPLVPSTPEEIMELLSVAQKYQMGTALTHIRGSISQENSLPTSLESSLRIYVLAQKYGLRREAIQTARVIFLKQSMTIEDLENTFNIIPGSSLYELWKYHERVQAVLVSDLKEFRMSCARGTITGLRCTVLSFSQIPGWLYFYIESIGKSPNLFDYAELSTAMARHIKDKANEPGCECASIPGQTIRNFWEALESVVHGSFKKAESALCLVREREDSQTKISLTMPPPKAFDVPDANFIIRSSDNVNFRVHKSVLAMASPFFKDLLSLPQPSVSEIVDGHPVVQLSESSELLSSLVSILYPIPTVIPNSYEKVLHLLAACQKYEMASVQSLIRAKVKLGEFPAPDGAEAFTAYAIASAKGLIPELENAARHTLNYPMSFKFLGEGLRLFEGCALSDLVNYRKRCRDNFIACLDSFLKVHPPGLSSIWIGCPEAKHDFAGWGQIRQCDLLPIWLKQLLSRNQNDLKLQNFTGPLDIHLRIRREYFTALQNHSDCSFCSEVHTRSGATFCEQLENMLAQARDKESVGHISGGGV